MTTQVQTALFLIIINKRGIKTPFFKRYLKNLIYKTMTKSPFGKGHPYHKINEFLHSNVFATPFIQSAIDYYCERCTDEEIDKELKDSTIVAPELWKHLRDNAKKTV